VHNDVGVRTWIYPHRRSGEAGMAEASDGEDHASRLRRTRIDIPAEAPRILSPDRRIVRREQLIRTHSNAGDNSGGEQEKLMAFCLAGALSFNLASTESADNRPAFAQLMLDEAVSKSDPQFAQQALQAFRKFGFQLVIGVMVSKTEATGRDARPAATVATRTILEFTSLRQEMRATAKRVPAGV
jgi:uncharacterized protein YPO0396